MSLRYSINSERGNWIVNNKAELNCQTKFFAVVFFFFLLLNGQRTINESMKIEWNEEEEDDDDEIDGWPDSLEPTW